MRGQSRIFTQSPNNTQSAEYEKMRLEQCAQNVVPRAAASVSAGNLLETHHSGPIPDPSDAGGCPLQSAF